MTSSGFQDTSAPAGGRRSRRTLIGALVGATVLVVAGAALYVTAFQPRPSTASLSMRSASVSLGETVDVSGEVSPAAAGRVVAISIRGGGAAWREVARATTDATGAFATGITAPAPGVVRVRAEVLEQGRYLADATEAKSLQALEPTEIRFDGKNLARTTQRVEFSGHLAPAGDRTVFLQRSADQESWEAIAESQANADGTFRLLAKRLEAGVWHFRAFTEETDTAASGESSAISVTVENYEAAGTYYLKVIEDWNAVLDRYNETADQYDAGSASFEAVKKAAADLSAKSTSAGRALKKYDLWPREVEPLIKKMATFKAVDADIYHQMAGAGDIQEFISVLNRGMAGFDAHGSHSAVIREVLGLPKRPTN